MTFLKSVVYLLLCTFCILISPLYADIKKANEAYDKQNYDLAAEEYTKLANLNNAEAQAKLGVMYFWGWGVRQSNYQAYNWSLKAAKQDNQLGQQMMGYLYEEGIIVSKNIRKAISWYEQSAAQDFAPAIASLANIYIRGGEIPKNIKRAFTYAQKAANKNNAYAQYLLALLYQNENKDYLLARKWLTKSALLGYADAPNELGIHYHQGLGLAKNPKKAYFWFVIAAERGSLEGVNNRTKVRQNMEYDDIKAVEKEAFDWLKKNPITQQL
ncbi:tetratricopeptide repeat protein [Aliikangiella sp. IMCC44359]|uniref:tetratricopeptide repeat protein n=1 Tax=Aliikangiella sp. IMCC44359 TaxID=3459125 RepID=UPI00403AA1AA